MTVTQVRQALGSWQLTLKPTVPRELLNALVYFGHIAVIDGRVDVRSYGDGLLTSARYVGVYRDRAAGTDNRTPGAESPVQLSGVGMAFWLGDESGGGDLFEDAVELSSATFANSVRALLPPGGAVTEGTLHSAPGTYTGRHQFQTPRTAIDYVCETFQAEWRVNGDATLDAGAAEDLYDSEPAVMLAKRAAGRDPALIGYQGKIDVTQDVEGWASRIVLLAEGSGLSIATGSADIAVNPYKDLNGNPVVLTRLVSESATVPTLADDRAQIALAEVDSTRRSVRLSTSDYVLDGDLVVGGYVYVYDPDSGLYDTANEATFRGQRVNPIKLRVTEITWPITEGMTVAYRDPDGVWWDLTDHVTFEAGDTSLTVGELPRSLTGAGVEPVGTRPAVDTTTPDAPVWVTPFQSQTYLDGRGFSKSRVLLSWNAPINTDGSTILDGDHYEIRYRVDTDVIYPQTWASLSATPWNQLNTWDQPFTPTTSAWQTVYAAWGESTYMLQELSTGVGYDVQIRAVDSSGNAGTWSSEVTFTTNADNIAPSTPAAPSVAGSRIALQVTHELGRASGGTYNLESDLHHLEIHVEYEPTFTPSDSTLKGKVSATAGMMQAGVPAVATVQVEETSTRYVKVIAVDIAGNKSSPSAAASATALLIDDAHISDLTVTKVTAGTISSNWLIGASIRTGTSGARVELNSSGLQAYNSGGTQTVDIDASTGDVSIVGQLSSGTSGERVVVSPTGYALPAIRFYPTTGDNYASLVSRARPGEPTETELYITASKNAEDTARAQLAVLAGTVSAYVYDETQTSNNGGALDINETTGSNTVALACRTGSRTLDGAVFQGSDTYAEMGFRDGSSNENYFYYDDDGKTSHIGKWDDFVDRGATQGLFSGSVSNLTSGADTASISYGTTKSSMMLPIVAVRDNPTVANTRGFVITANDTSSFTVQMSGAANGVWALYFWCFRI